jgi:hypothetical protein
MRVAVGLGIVAALTAFAASPVQAAPVPSSLKALESSAEDLVDFALSGSRRETAATAAKLTALASGPAAATLGRFRIASRRRYSNSTTSTARPSCDRSHASGSRSASQ